MGEITLEAQVDAVKREIGQRNHVYPRLVAAGRMTQAKADHDLRDDGGPVDRRGRGGEGAAAVSAWQPIETAPKAEDSNVAPICVLLAWFNVTAEGGRSYHVGEGYWYPDETDSEGGQWWWANTAPGDYYSSCISESIAGRVAHWQPMPEPPKPPPVWRSPDTGVELIHCVMKNPPPGPPTAGLLVDPSNDQCWGVDHQGLVKYGMRLSPERRIERAA